MITLPEIPTLADVEAHGEDAVLEALRERFRQRFAQYPQYDGWTDDTILAKITQRIGGGDTFVRAEIDDVVPVKRSERERVGLMYSGDHCWVPRVGWHCEFSYGVRRTNGRFTFQDA